MTHKRITPLMLFKVLFLILVYISTTIGWFFFVAPSLISSASTLEVLTGFFGTACWLIVSACLFIATTHKPSQSADSTENTQ